MYEENVSFSENEGFNKSLYRSYIFNPHIGVHSV